MLLGAVVPELRARAEKLAAEIATDEGGVDHDLGLGQVERGGDLFAKRGIRLVGVDDPHAVLAEMNDAFGDQGNALRMAGFDSLPGVD